MHSPIIRAAIFIIAVPLALFGMLPHVLGAPSTPAIEVASPSGKSVAIKQYGPFDEAERLVVSIRDSHGHSYPLISRPNPTGVINEDGVTFGWDGDQHLTIGWPNGGAAVAGADQVGDIKVSYRSYDPVLSNTRPMEMPHIPLQNSSVNFREEDGHHGNARYSTTGEPVPEIKCIIELNGVDGKFFSKVSAQFIGDGIGKSDDKYKSFGAVGVRVALEPLLDGSSPRKTLTSAEIAGVFPQNKLAAAPYQEAWSVYYRLFNKNEALKVFSEIKQGNTNLIIALNFGDKTINYEVSVPFSREISGKFNECSKKTNIYGSPFFLPLD
jgi:hypothetical protein